MFERFTDRAYRVLILAEEEARSLNHDGLGPSHLLLGLLRQGEGTGADVLTQLGIPLDKVRQAVLEKRKPGDEPPSGRIFFTRHARQVVELAGDQAQRLDDEHIGTEHLLLGLAMQSDGVSVQALTEHGGQFDRLRDQVKLMHGSAEASTESRGFPSELGEDLTAYARSPLTNPLILRSGLGREGDVEKVMRILAKRIKNCPVLVSEPGVKKDIVLTGVATKVGALDAPEPFRGSIMLRVDVTSLPVLGTLIRLVPLSRKLILVFDDIETVPSTRLGELLTIGGLRIIGMTTSYEFARDPLFEPRFEPVEVTAPTVSQAVAILMAEGRWGPTDSDVSVTDEAVVAAATLAERFVSEKPLPGSASELLDEAFADAQRQGGTPEVTEDSIVQVVARLRRTPAVRVRAALPSKQAPFDGKPDYALLTDQPIGPDDDDLLGTAAVAQGIAAILARAASPFVLAIDGRWGVGKSTLLRQIEAALPEPPNMVKVSFNAWTAQSENALEALIKSVIGGLGKNQLQRWLRSLAGDRRVVRFARIGMAVLARFFGATTLADELWHRLEVNAKSQNELRTLIRKGLARWAQDHPERTLVVFIDDLDRCEDEVIVKVCEAVKVYLDAPGLVFVIGCDLSVIARGVRGSEGRTYLEKIIQVVHRVPAPNQDGIAALILGCAEKAGIEALMDDTVIDILSERTGRNPRSIKRIINSFVLEHAMNTAWQRPPLGSVQLIAVIILQHLYPQFYERLSSEGAGADEDPITEFLDYATVRARANEAPSTTDTWWATASRVFRRYGGASPSREAGADLSSDVERFERILPLWFPELALNEALLALLREIGGIDTRRAVRAQLVNRPLGTGAFPTENLAGSATGSAAD